MMYYIAAIIIALTTVVSENAFAVYGEGNYSIDVEGTDKGLSSVNFDLKVRGRERLVSFSPILKGNINLQEKSLAFSYTQADFFNSFVDLRVGQDVLPGVTGLTASAPQINGMRLASNKKLWGEHLTPAVFKGVSSSSSDVYGGKVDFFHKLGVSGNAFYFKDTRAGDAIGGSLNMPLLFWKMDVEAAGSRQSAVGSSSSSGGTGVGSTTNSVGTLTVDEQNRTGEDIQPAGSGTETAAADAGRMPAPQTERGDTQPAGSGTETAAADAGRMPAPQLGIGSTTTIYPLNLALDCSTGRFGGDGYKVGGTFKLKGLSSNITYSLINGREVAAWNGSYGFKGVSLGLGCSNDRGATSVSNWRLNAGYGTATRAGSLKLNGEYSSSDGDLPSNKINVWKLNSDYGTATKLGNLKLNGEYSSSNGQIPINDINRWKISGLFDSKRIVDMKLNTEYSVSSSPCFTNNISLWKCGGDFKLGKRWWLNWAFSNDHTPGTSSPEGSLGYNWNSGYRWNFSKEFTLSLSKQQSFRELTGENDRNLVNYLSVKIDFSPQFPLSVSSEIGLEKTDSISKNRLKEQLSLRRNLSLRYSYKGFNPWLNYSLTGTDDRTIANGDISRENITVGLKKKLTRNLTGSIQRMCQLEENQYISGNRINFVERITTEKKADLTYKFPNYPLNMDLEFFSNNGQKFNWKVSFSFREKDRQNYLRYVQKSVKFTEAKEFRFGAPPQDMTPVSKKLPDKNEFSRLGIVSISVFKDADANRVFSPNEEGLEGIKVKMFEKGENKEKARVVTTKENGRACFVDIPAGLYNLNIDLGSVPIDFICVAELEQVIRVEAGKGIELKFPLQKAGNIEGRVFRDENRNGIWDAGETGDHDLMVYANDVPTFTSSGGLYRFSNIPPGKMRVRIDKSGLPKGYILTTPEFFDVELKSEGEVEGINFGMAEQEAEIEFE